MMVSGALVVLSGCNASDPLESPTAAASLGNTNAVLQQYQPALAVRGIECLLCHAQVQSSIMTDFGYGDPQYFVNQHAGTIYGSLGGVPAEDSKPLTLPWYGNYYGTWQLANQINGTIVVPKVLITDAATLTSLNQTSPISLAQMLSIDTGPSFYEDAPDSGAGSMLAKATPLANNPAVSEIDEMYIGAPTAAQLLSLTPVPSNTAVGVLAIGTTSSISGLSVQTGTGGTYVTNTGVVNCIGDVVIRGTLFLNNATIATDNNGCRLMVTQSTFIQGQVSYSDTSGSQNLQVSSARAILMGFDTTTLATRLQSQWYPDAQPLTRYAGTNTQKNTAILAEANVIGSALHDSNDAAACPTQMVTYVGLNGSYTPTLTQCSINFQRLLVNAPDIESRYIGQFKGVVIAEIALFAPGELNFVYDQTFNTVPILPVLPPILNVPGINPPSAPPTSGCTGIFCSGPVTGI